MRVDRSGCSAAVCADVIWHPLLVDPDEDPLGVGMAGGGVGVALGLGVARTVNVALAWSPLFPRATTLRGPGAAAPESVAEKANAPVDVTDSCAIAVPFQNSVTMSFAWKPAPVMVNVVPGRAASGDSVSVATAGALVAVAGICVSALVAVAGICVGALVAVAGICVGALVVVAPTTRIACA